MCMVRKTSISSNYTKSNYVISYSYHAYYNYTTATTNPSFILLSDPRFAQLYKPKNISGISKCVSTVTVDIYSMKFNTAVFEQLQKLYAIPN